MQLPVCVHFCLLHPFCLIIHKVPEPCKEGCDIHVPFRHECSQFYFFASWPVSGICVNFPLLHKNLLWVILRDTLIYGYYNMLLDSILILSLFIRLIILGSTLGPILPHVLGHVNNQVWSHLMNLWFNLKGWLLSQ